MNKNLFSFLHPLLTSPKGKGERAKRCNRQNKKSRSKKMQPLHQEVKASNAAHLSPCKGEKERGYIHVFLFYNCGVSYFLTLSSFHFITFLLLSICKLRGCQEIGSNLARVPIEATNLFSARKNARILRLRIALIMSQLHIYRQLSPSFYPSKTP